MNHESFDRESHYGGAYNRSFYFGDSDDDHVVYKRKNFHYQVEQEEEVQESGEGEEEFAAEKEFGEEEVEEFGEEEDFGEEAVEEFGEEEVGEERESYCVENDEEISSALSSNKRVTQCIAGFTAYSHSLFSRYEESGED